MSKIGAIVLMNGETKSAFEGANMVFEEIRIFVEVDCFESELPKTLSAVGICAGEGCDASTAEFATGAVLRRTILECRWMG